MLISGLEVLNLYRYGFFTVFSGGFYHGFNAVTFSICFNPRIRLEARLHQVFSPYVLFPKKTPENPFLNSSMFLFDKKGFHQKRNIKQKQVVFPSCSKTRICLLKNHRKIDCTLKGPKEG